MNHKQQNGKTPRTRIEPATLKPKKISPSPQQLGLYEIFVSLASV
jgi:hypothetical protein